VTQAVECLSSKHQALSLNPSTAPKKRKCNNKFLKKLYFSEISSVGAYGNDIAQVDS
jgi:hypothetical protein